MTSFQQRLYRVIEAHIDQYGDSPSFTVMVKAMGIRKTSKSLITQTLRVLQAERLIRLERSGRRLLITLIKNELLLLGKISAGMPIDAFNDPKPLGSLVF